MSCRQGPSWVDQNSSATSDLGVVLKYNLPRPATQRRRLAINNTTTEAADFRRMWRHSLLPIGIHRSSKTAENATSVGFGWNFSAATFCLPHQLVGILFKSSVNWSWGHCPMFWSQVDLSEHLEVDTNYLLPSKIHSIMGQVAVNLSVSRLMLFCVEFENGNELVCIVIIAQECHYFSWYNSFFLRPIKITVYLYTLAESRKEPVCLCL